ncbi:phenylalanine--tRNA ligase subunit beta [Candidatus Azobacteroides pseudotrichonymphae]|uniref:Phenylalanine--tRNA ligase beta subunit n=1 Tax=Azobacteroides pseudotrichonymphae genomovar. CFP2 TaxID=511995 RepID=B6YRM1_AZOPC|nr:phenylalanine--tRNA ligase subunit beta [Candidatus Azobacteroides pseudotrichonymphae]BAG83843.1 phenylalanyl-tRNA synthetase beta subunit [Candidatus Azobacteroides pseudotrichonymphae genomovar. CFP2]
MNISFNWLKEYLSFDLSPNQLADILTSIGLETNNIKEVEIIKGGLKGLIIGQVLTCENHPNSDHLYITTVDLGMDRPQQIVCGASNVAIGQKVIVAPVGTTLYSGGKIFTIKKSKIRGIESNGMICAEDEIGIGEAHNGIVVLPETIKIGIPASEYYQLKNDYVLEINITPNRIDAASHYGVARDLAAYLSFHHSPSVAHRFNVDSFKIEDKSPIITVKVEDILACPRYTGVTIKNVQVKESPNWLKRRLKAIGVRSINNVVDITNYILHETGQPIHAFDLKAIKGNKIFVKTLPKGTTFVTLDGIERRLSSEDLMICNEEIGMCIGGVLGGLDSGVTMSTKNIFLESASFNPTYIRRTARFHGLNTDASFRFERGTDSNNTLYALKRAALLIKDIAGGIIVGEIQDIYPNKVTNKIVELDIRKANSLIGKNISEKDIETIFDGLEIVILNKKNYVWSLSIPSYRVDVTRDVDVIEEILRIYGYNNVEMKEEIKSTLSFQTSTDRKYELQNIISEQLAGSGFNEILNNSLTSSTYYESLTFFSKKKCIPLYNPLSSDLDIMRQTLLFGGLESIEYNCNHKNSDLKFYEFGNVYFHFPVNGNDCLTSTKEEFHLALWIIGNSIVGNWVCTTEKSSIYELKSYTENILFRLGIPSRKIVYILCDNDIFSSGLFIKTLLGKQLGILGILQKSICKKFSINTEVYFAELNWDLLIGEIEDIRIKQTDIPKFPFVKRDLSLLLDTNVLFAEIEKIAYQIDKKILKEIRLFDVYEGGNLPEGKKSYAVSFILQDQKKTLDDKQIENLMNCIQKKLEEKLNAQLRWF